MMNITYRLNRFLSKRSGRLTALALIAGLGWFNLVEFVDQVYAGPRTRSARPRTVAAASANPGTQNLERMAKNFYNYWKKLNYLILF